MPSYMENYHPDAQTNRAFVGGQEKHTLAHDTEIGESSLLMKMAGVLAKVIFSPDI